jgi:hypothetical protein
MPAKLYSQFPLNLGGGDTSGEGPMDLLSDTIKLMLFNAHTPTQTGDALKADLPAEESSASGSGYTAGGATLANKTYTTSSLVTTFTNTLPIVWTIVGTLSTDTGILWDDTPTSPADPLIMYDDFGSQTVTDGDFTYTPAGSGFLTITVS